MNTPKDRLKTLRNLMGLTQKELAERLNLSFYQYKDLESGRVKISPMLAKLIFYETGFEIEWLLEGSGKMKSDLTKFSFKNKFNAFLYLKEKLQKKQTFSGGLLPHNKPITNYPFIIGVALLHVATATPREKRIFLIK